MQNNDNHPTWKRVQCFIREKGYYIVLFLCICAVGISGYLFVSNAVSEKDTLNDATLSVATRADDPAAAPQSKPSAAQTPAPQPTAPAAAMTDEAVRAEAKKLRIWPVGGAQQTPYSADALRYNATTQDWRTHAGIDLSAAVGTPVKAAGSGVVTAVYDDEYLGTSVVIEHPDGHVSQYSNLAVMPSVCAGDTVEAGTVIGAVGQSALLELADEPHLHFAVFSDGQSVDPADFIG